LPNDEARVAEVRFSAAARKDLASIGAYGAEHFGHDIADAYARGFIETFDLLSRHPEVGSARFELGAGIRCQLHRRHRIFYCIEDERVLVVRIVHHAMDERAALKAGSK
jgi:toxin ParE1/3/4